ncbi:NAD-dependent epimerase/dehydratase family protein [Ruminococcus sp.]|uniref:NAD-dependent epimerase/dehydratase family protein n=1 Tax=Ruminococcus sp. TaxID=41978 RepID=UPI0038902DBD
MKKVFVTGKRGSLSVAVAEYLKNNSKNSVEQISLRGDAWKSENFSSFDAVVHIAGVTPQNAKATEDYDKINTELTRELAEKCRHDGVSQFIYISSMAVYGIAQSMDIKKGTVTAETIPAPDSDYGKSKLQAEKALKALESDDFRIAVIRVPSIYGKGKTEYIDQYQYLAEKLPVIPRAFENYYKSAICVQNLCELIRLTIQEHYAGMICPDDGQISAVDFCSAIYPDKKKSRFLGKLIELFLKNNSRILDYYGAVCYAKELTNVFEGRYRITDFKKAVKQAYEG